MNKKKFTYKKSGVNINAADNFINFISLLSSKKKGKKKFSNIGGFGSITNIPKNIKNPKIVACTDGVGTKLELAKTTGLHHAVGIDLVAMCANDILAQGAMPLFFLDYFATGKLDRAMAIDVIAGIADGCIEADCALIGGETAEMPGMYPAGTYDLAGFCIGAAERGTLLSRGQPKVGDIAIALRSSGIHSNGFSLVRKIIDNSGVNLDSSAPFESDADHLGAKKSRPKPGKRNTHARKT